MSTSCRRRCVPGNSGGPFVLDDGTSPGWCSPLPPSDRTSGYAIASTEVQPLVERATRRTARGRHRAVRALGDPLLLHHDADVALALQQMRRT